MTSSLLTIKNLSKNFSGITVLENINLTIETGSCHILAGENGAGKSTLIKIICGYYALSSGEMLFEEQPYLPQSPQDSIKKGIRAVYQELNLLPHLTVAENIFFDKLPKNRLGLVNKKILYQKTEEALARFGLDISPEATVSQLGIAHMQLVEIAKALSREAKLLILDEPTATLTPKEIDKLFAIIKKLKAQGVTIIYISHRLNELKEIGDNISILRNGTIAKTCPISELTTDEIIEHMIGRSIDKEYPFDSNIPIGKILLKVKNITTNKIKNINFSTRQGEIVGLAGLVGSGRTELLRAIFGADKIKQGEIFIKDKLQVINTPKEAVKKGMSFITEDRKNQGLILDLEIYKNISLTTIARYTNYGFLKKNEEITLSEKSRSNLQIKSASNNQHARFLSGGNQQKVIFAKWLNTESDIILLDEPTRGIDVGAKYEIYLLLNELAKDNKTILVASSDIHELIGICHRIIVMSNGSISGEVSRENFDPTHILSLSYKNYLS
ncbi:monosaccharide ABC transporter ATP-binding protein (CUT2 family) [Bisgaardia hudsonensis]|uniref:Monosaccharide ABC transporter ATP-binding protein (CUT2 family) n=1 Tax=Bisgaardia hudsonensis TaxID=109472 RepID=A0A4V2SIU6_9PAST|nr:sugar ABC transporter ATP-binding protein [Bisgaardia hudsonensis]QLB13550.1 D-xylose ABC transporter ATP-binding protein [Bisgaardia hudsonensis]TCP11174.1 monosaccharide ABC transporter ATP-binding protein (CUT2 family) [Bisgaardia hudsonensis]